MKKTFNIAAAALIIVAFIFSIYQKEQVIADGKVIYLELVPVDPRSIMQGDYMRLRYAIEDTSGDAQKSGYMALKIDDKGIGEFAGYYAANKQLENGDVWFKYNSSGARKNIEPSSFLFQQGLRSLYARAKYGIFKVTDSEHLLVGLADGDLIEIKPPLEKID